MTTLQVRTPEGVTFSYTLASPITRFLAWAVDAVAILAISRAIGPLLTLMSVISQDLGQAVSILTYFVLSVGYGMVCEFFWRGQTLGKRLLSLRVMDEQGLHLRWSQVVIRNLLRTVDLLPALYALGGLACFLTRRAQRLGDLAAGTVVVRTPKVTPPDVEQIASGKFNSLRLYPHLEARLRQKISPAEAGVLVEALLRRDAFTPAARLTLFADLAQFCREQVRFPAEVADSLGDEQYVRNVVEIIFSPAGAAKTALVSE